MASAQRTGLLSTETMPPENENAFTRANVFGLFLTLTFVLLVQPFGSLVYTKPRHAFGRTIFFFWRLHPLACALEAILLILALLHGIYMAVRSRRDPAANKLRFREHMQVAALAVSRLRRHGGLPDHLRAFATSQQAPAPFTTSSDEPNSSEIRTGENPGAALPMENNPTTQSQQGGGQSAMSISYTDRIHPVSGSEIRRDHSDAAPQIVSRNESLPRVEAGNQDDAEAEVMRNSDSRFSDTALGRSVLSHAEHVIDLISTLAVLVVTIKLGASTIPNHIYIPAWFMILDWAAVQILLFTVPRREITGPDHVIRHVLELERILSHPITWASFCLICSPLFGYFTSAMIFKTNTIPLTLRGNFICLLFLYVSCVNPLYYRIIPDLFYSGCFSRRRKTPCEQLQNCLSGFRSKSAMDIFLIVLIYGVIQLFSIGIGVGLMFLLILSMGICLTETDPAWKWRIMPFTVYPVMMWMWFFLPAIPFKWNSKSIEWVKGISLFFNLITSICFFAGAMIMYDDSDTYKPGWVEWFGRLEKWRRLFQDSVSVRLN